MKLSVKTFLTLTLAVLCGIPMYSADLLKPKREMRTVWLATAWRIDWPAEYDKNNNPIRDNIITVTGNEAQINKQKQVMITMLDSLAKNNMNCVNFQVRSRCDALYKSAYEPWSSEIVATRGMDPGYDPLQFVIDECHKRGMECHAWVNPYRYESESGAWSGKAGDYRKEHPDWIMDFAGKSILNPGKPEVTQRIVDICKDIITKYDVDGILYDDYFYIEDTEKKSYHLDKGIYDDYVQGGGKLSQGDWRRENVNAMIKSVYSMIQEVKPWVRFGVSPAGVAASDLAVASKYGVPPSPGGDWQYDKICSDPLAWISSHSLDFISPQLYWTIGHTTDYAKVAPWWAMVADKFKRHLFVSHDITALNYNSKGDLDVQGMSNLERRLSAYQPKSSGPNRDTFKEFADQVKLNRESSLDDSPGSFFYSAKFMSSINLAPLFSHYLGKTVFTKPAILPAMTYKYGYNPGKVKNLKLEGGKLLWDGYDNVRYTVYAVPGSVEQNDFNFEVDYLLGTSYDTSYEIPEAYGSGYQFAVCVLDRVGNEYTPIFLGSEMKKIPAPALVAPADGALADDPFNFEWSAVDGAKGYIIEMAYDPEFKNMFRTMMSDVPKFSSALIEGLQSSKFYWRVRSMAVNCEDGVSAVFTVIPNVLTLKSPVDNSVTNVTPVIQWSYEGGEEGLVEIATDANFMDETIMHTGTSSTSSYIVPEYILKSSTKYYTRVTVTKSGVSKTSNSVGFTTECVEATAPVFAYPKDGGKFYSEDKITLERQPGAHSFYLELAQSDDFPSRTKYAETLKNFGYESIKGGGIKIGSKNLVEGTTYYIRASASYINEEGVTVNTGSGNVISFIYGGQGSGVEDNISGIEVKVTGFPEPVLSVSAPLSSKIDVRVFNTVGIQEGILYDGEVEGYMEIPLSSLTNGMHIIAVNINGSVKVLKVIK